MTQANPIIRDLFRFFQVGSSGSFLPEIVFLRAGVLLDEATYSRGTLAP